MQLIFLPYAVMIVSFFLFWPACQLLISVLCLKIPLKNLDHRQGFYRPRAWEGRKFYERIFRVHAWKRFLPDGAALAKDGFRKKKLVTSDPVYLERFLAESCRAELSHWISILPFWVPGLWAPSFVIPMMLVYALAVNLPCIIAQRHNRPRFAALLEKTKIRAAREP